MQSHDQAYKQLFSNPELVRDLLRDVVRQDWVELVDFSTLERSNASYVSKKLQSRHSDLLWSAQLKPAPGAKPNAQPERLYIYLLLEFQSSVDRHMAARLMTYMGLLYEDLIKTHKHYRCGKAKLPAVLPLVLYNGAKPWRAAQNLSDLIAPTHPSLEPYRPRLHYFTLDVHHTPSLKNLSPSSHIATVVRFEHCTQAAEVAALSGHVAQAWPQSPDHHNLELERSWINWIGQYIMARNLPKIDDPTHSQTHAQLVNLAHAKTFTEFHDMAHKNVQIWADNLRNEGILAGKILGELKGKAEGEARGKAEGKAEALRRLIVRKFGSIAPVFEQRITQATLEQLDAWFDAGLDATNIEAVFASH